MGKIYSHYTSWMIFTLYTFHIGISWPNRFTLTIWNSTEYSALELKSDSFWILLHLKITAKNSSLLSPLLLLFLAILVIGQLDWKSIFCYVLFFQSFLYLVGHWKVAIKFFTIHAHQPIVYYYSNDNDDHDDDDNDDCHRHHHHCH